MGSVIFWAVLHCIGFATGGPVGTAVVLGLWLLVSYLPGKKAEAREEARFFSDLGGDDDTEAMGVYTSAQIDFETMTMTSRASGIDIDERATHELRRDGGGWASRLTPASRKEEIARLEARLAKIKAGGVGFEESTREALAAVRRNDWAAFDGHEASKVEVAYQRYLKTL